MNTTAENTTATATHTPGPWHNNGNLIAPTPTGKRFAIAEVFCDNVQTAKANARLIAAAPELLHALKETLRASPMGAHVKLAQAAIGKATGGARKP